MVIGHGLEFIHLRKVVSVTALDYAQGILQQTASTTNVTQGIQYASSLSLTDTTVLLALTGGALLL